MPTISSVHIPAGLGTISVRGRGTKKKVLSIDEVSEYANQHKISFMTAYRELVSDFYKSFVFEFDLNSTVNEGRFRIRDPREFDGKSFRSWDRWGDLSDEGIRFIVGNLNNTGEKGLQAVRFDKDKWTEEKAGQWIEDSDIKRISVGKFEVFQIPEEEIERWITLPSGARFPIRKGRGGNNYRDNLFKNKAQKDRAERYGLTDVEGSDLTDEGIVEKAKEWQKNEGGVPKAIVKGWKERLAKSKLKLPDIKEN